MLKIFVCIFIGCYSLAASAQDVDSIFVEPKNNGWVIEHTVEPGETVFTLSRRFHVPPAVLTDANGGLSYQNLPVNTTINIPVGAYNLMKDRKVQMEDQQPLYYTVQDEDNLYRISKYSGVSQHTMQEWNSLADNSVIPGQVLLVGWVLYDATQIPAMTGGKPLKKQHVPATADQQHVAMGYGATETATQNVAADNTLQDSSEHLTNTDTTAHIGADLEVEYLNQTNHELNVNSEKGAAVFFGPDEGSAQKTFYALHNNTARGTIIKVFNPGTGKTVFVKVLGPLPETKQYYNAVIGISSAAKSALGVNENKTWCELSYGSFY